MIVNTRIIDPMTVITGAAEYPEGVLEKLLAAGADVISTDALELALKAGSPKAVNVVLVGIMAARLDIDKEVWINAIKETVPEKFLELNLEAFELGYTVK